MENETYTYQDYTIKPKRDFPKGGVLSNGRVVTRGFVVCNRIGCNIMPGATWFETVLEACQAIDVLIKVNGCSEMFWEAMQPFEWRVGYPTGPGGVQQGEMEHGRFKAIVKDGVVVDIIETPWSQYPHHFDKPEHWRP